MRPLEPDAAEGPRRALLDCISQTPGAHLRAIERMSGLPLGQVLYHLDRLERMGLVASAKDQGFRRYYACSAVDRGEKKYLAALRHDAPRRIVLSLLERPRLTHKELQERLGVAGSTLTFHLQRLLGSGVLARQRDGASHVYDVVEPHLAARQLVYYRESFRDEAVDRFVRALLDRTLQPAPARDPEPDAGGGAVRIPTTVAS